MKARLNCSIPGDYPFEFDEIQSSSALLAGLYSFPMTAPEDPDLHLRRLHHRQVFMNSALSPQHILYAVFTTNVNSLPASAVCAFSMNQIERVFAESAFKAPLNGLTTSNWLPVPANRMPPVRPGQCACPSEPSEFRSDGNSPACNRTTDEPTLQFINSNPLMDEAIQPLFGGPLITSTDATNRWTKIVVHSRVPLLAPGSPLVDVLFIGTDDGHVVRSVTLTESAVQVWTSGKSAVWNALKPIMLEKIAVFSNKQPIRDLRLNLQVRRMVVFSFDKIRSIPIQRCSSSASSCSACVKLQDPYCAWNVKRKACVEVASQSK